MWPIIWAYQSHDKLTVGDINWHWHVSVFMIFTPSFAVVNHAGLPLTDTRRPGTAGRWGCLPTHLSGSFSPRIGPCCPVEDQRCCGSTRRLGASAAHAHEQRWPAGVHMTDSFNECFFCVIIYLEKKKDDTIKTERNEINELWLIRYKSWLDKPKATASVSSHVVWC